jgi:hypothetical protein
MRQHIMRSVRAVRSVQIEITNAFFPWRNTLPCISCAVSICKAAVAFEECGQLYPRRQSFDRHPCTLVQQYLREKGAFSSVNRTLPVKYNSVWRNRKTLFTCYSDSHAPLHEEFPLVSVYGVSKSVELYTETDCIHKISCAFSIFEPADMCNRLKLYHRINSPPQKFVIFVLQTRSSSAVMESIVSHNEHRTVEKNLQYHFP